MSDSAIYRVTAHALNLRTAPALDAAKLGVMPGGAEVVGVGASPDPAWILVVWNGLRGYAYATHLQAVSSAPGVMPLAIPAGTPPGPSVENRDRDMAHLHPVVREGVGRTLAALEGEGIPFRLFEAFRTPERQAHLYAQGRTRAGDIVTRALPWQSYHQYGLACDLVLFENGGWSWDASGARAAWWNRMRDVAASHNLRTLSFERPHVEFDGPRWQDLQQGDGYPPGGDDSWLENLTLAASRWRAAGRTPPGPPLQFAQRPPLTEAA